MQLKKIGTFLLVSLLVGSPALAVPKFSGNYLNLSQPNNQILVGPVTTANLVNALNSGSYSMFFRSGAPDGTVPFIFNTLNAISGVNELFSLQNAGSEFIQLNVDGSGYIGSNNTPNPGGGFILGGTSSAPGATSVCVGNSHTCGEAGFGTSATSIGFNDISGGLRGSVAIGDSNKAYGLGAVSIGLSNGIGAPGGTTGSVAIGTANSITGSASSVYILGKNLTTTNLDIGYVGSGALGTRITRNSVTAFGFGTTYFSFYTEKGIRSYLDTPGFSIGNSQNVSGSTELVTNGTFTGSAAGWTFTTPPWAYNSNNIIKNADGVGTLAQAFTGLEIGSVYVLSFKILNLLVGGEGVTPSLPTEGITFQQRIIGAGAGGAVYFELFVATATTDTITFTPTNISRFTLDNVTIKKVAAGNLSIAGNFRNNGSVSCGMDTMTYAATITLDTTLQCLHKTTTVNATGNATINASSAGFTGQVMQVLITNDPTAGETITFGTNFLSTGTLLGTISKSAIVTFVSDGTAFYESARSTGL